MPEAALDVEEASTENTNNANGNGNGTGTGNSTDCSGNDSGGNGHNEVGNLFETFMRTQQFQNSLKALFQRRRPSIQNDNPIPLGPSLSSDHCSPTRSSLTALGNSFKLTFCFPCSLYSQRGH
ncbi:hypothetical protein CDL15_Pgr001776 [Punica granatum]|uniref:Uncharacterized protein n=1 Tax=Punica granatum TaxID=22663 RepID=A0A218XCW8_PUNGR|nr:hypothetical protein CDL15_Pgr001776 [Punica granatum]PKI58724.1 hypothetical protein CRG98_020880 [Punica granatum]